MTEAIYLEVSEKTEAAKKAGRQVSVSGMLKFLGVSRSGYLVSLWGLTPEYFHHRSADDLCSNSLRSHGKEHQFLFLP